MMKELKFKNIHGWGKLPERGSKNAAGLDLFSVENVWLQTDEVVTIGTGIAVEIPEGYYGRIAPRSGLAIGYGIDVLAGVVDSDYRGEIRVAFISHVEKKHIYVGDKIAQLIIEKIETPEPVWAEDELSETERGVAGFGSTGR